MKVSVLGFPYSLYVAEIPGITDAVRRQREDIAVAKLVTEAFGQGAVRHNDSIGTPYILMNGRVINVEVSVSHSRSHAVLAVAPQGIALGVDIEDNRQQLQRVAPRILSASELRVYSSLPLGLLKAWTMKEALYKATRRSFGKELDFTANIQLPLKPGGVAKVCGDYYEKLFQIAFTSLDCNTNQSHPGDSPLIALAWECQCI